MQEVHISARDAAPLDEIGKVLREFAARHDFNLSTLQALMVEKSVLTVEQAQALLAELEQRINSGLVLCSAKAKAKPRAMLRRESAAQRKLQNRLSRKRTPRERERAQEALKAYRRARA